jgi:hypothetical protein
MERRRPRIICTSPSQTATAAVDAMADEDPAGASYWGDCAIQDYTFLLLSAQALTADDIHARLESRDVYWRRALRAGLDPEWMDEQLYDVRQEWARYYDRQLEELPC